MTRTSPSPSCPDRKSSIGAVGVSEEEEEDDPSSLDDIIDLEASKAPSDPLSRWTPSRVATAIRRPSALSAMDDTADDVFVLHRHPPPPPPPPPSSSSSPSSPSAIPPSPSRW